MPTECIATLFEPHGSDPPRRLRTSCCIGGNAG